MINMNNLDLSKIDLSMLPPQLLGRLSFEIPAPSGQALAPGVHPLGIAAERDSLLYVPNGLVSGESVPLLVLFHGATGDAQRLLHTFAEHAERERLLLLAPHSMFRTWDLALGGNGPDLERLERALAAVATHFAIDATRMGFAGFSDGASYALSIGLTNGRLVTHVMALSPGFMNLYQPQGWPSVLIAHGNADEQLPAERCGKRLATQLHGDGYRVDYTEFEGGHVLLPAVVARAVAHFLGAR